MTPRSEKFVFAGHENQHAGRVRSPELSAADTAALHRCAECMHHNLLRPAVAGLRRVRSAGYDAEIGWAGYSRFVAESLRVTTDH
jgi:hypothetical protein